MAVIIEKKKNTVYTLSVDNMKDGHAYETEDGRIYIANKVPYEYCAEGVRTVAFSICGEFLVYDDEEMKFREVNLRVSVE